MFVRLTWDGDADFDLIVDEPLGATASYQTPRTVFGGSMIKNGYGSHPEEVYVCPEDSTAITRFASRRSIPTPTSR